MKRVLAITNNLKQASFRLRVEALVRPLESRGYAMDVQVRPRSWLARRRLLASATDYDAVLLQRKFLDPWDAKLLRKCARRIVYDIDDAVMFHQKSVGPIARWMTSRRFNATAKIADHVAAGNEYLAAMFREKGCDVTIVPTVVDPSHYQVKSHGPTDAPRLVWIGSHSTLPYVREFLPALAAAKERVPNLRLVTIGDATLRDDESPLPIEHHTWSADTEAADLCRGDIGIAPTPDTPWTRGKCGFKIVQYMAAGLPVIASPIGANAALVQEGKTGFLPKSTEEWADAIAQIASDPTIRGRMGNYARQRVLDELNLDRIADIWATLLG